MIDFPEDLRALLDEKLAEIDQLARDVRLVLGVSRVVVAAGRIIVPPSPTAAPAEATSDEDLEEFRRRSCESKKRYPTPERAGAAAETAVRLRGEKLRIYPCPICHGCHLTKVPLELAAERMPPTRDGAR